ncbi:hypothetical protein PO909_019896, partial [Leuciscus waleckii]
PFSTFKVKPAAISLNLKSVLSLQNPSSGRSNEEKIRMRCPAQRKRELQRPDDGRPSTSPSKRFHREMFQEWMCPPLPGQVPVEPVKTSNVPTSQGAMEDVNKSSTASGRSSGAASTDSPPGIMSTPSLSSSVGDVVWRFCGLSSRFSSTGTYIIEKRSSNSRSESQHEQGSDGNRSLSRSDSFQLWTCPPLPGQVPVETSDVPTAPGAMEDVIKSSTEKPTKHKKMERICSFFRNLWRSLSCCCSDSKAVDVVEPFVLPLDLDSEPFVPPLDLDSLDLDSEPFVPPLDLDSEPDSDPDHSGVEPNHDSFESLYNAGEMIGSGGFGRVFEGTRKFDGKRVAIKRMRKTSKDLYLAIPGHPEPLITEVALLLMMRQEPISPYAIQLHDWFEHPRKFTLVMEYPEPCESVLDFIIRNPQLDETTARVIMRQAVLAVQHCIDHDVFHNDVHAHNFLLKKDTLELKLIDFGSGQLLSSDGYDSYIYIGLLDYCPPEVFTEPRFHAIPANVWALGVLLYEMVNACPPFHNPAEIKEAKVTFQNTSLSNECSDLISQCLTLDPTKRPTLEQIFQHEWIRNDLL